MRVRPETEAEHIARDMREGRFPKRSVKQAVPFDQPIDKPTSQETNWRDEKLKAETELIQLQIQEMRRRLKPESESDYDGRIRRAAKMARQSFHAKEAIDYMEMLLLTTIGKNT